MSTQPIIIRMMTGSELQKPLEEFLQRFSNETLQDLTIESKLLHGGAEAAAVQLVDLRYRDNRGCRRSLRVVVKHLQGRPAREAAIYESLVAAHAPGLAPALLHVDRTGADQAILVIEAIRRTAAWPWRDVRRAEDLVTRLAQFHVKAEDAHIADPGWDYEAELGAMAESTREALDECRRDPELSDLAGSLRSVDDIVLALPELRRQLLNERPFGCRPIHGDVHPGNALTARRGRGEEPVLIDWGRARLGSPLEDLSSWLQSLGYWEPQGRRYHDTLATTYLAAFGEGLQFNASVRAAYWMAGASNALSGALLHHLRHARDPHQTSAARANAYYAAKDALRVIRRAHALWR
nr:aminoglycoside phosphotransferase family protein [Microvirga splendida]